MTRSAEGAEWILSLVTTRGRAAEAVGDALEQTESVAALWWFVLRTAARFSAREAWDARWQMLALGLGGLAMEAALTAVLWLGGMWVWISILHNHWGPAMADSFTPLWAVRLYSNAVNNVIIPVLVGRLVGRFSRGGEIGAGLTLAAMQAVLAFLIAMTLSPKVSVSLPWSLTIMMLLIAGALSWRAGHPRTAQA